MHREPGVASIMPTEQGGFHLPAHILHAKFQPRSSFADFQL
jgi:hypothetical protein